MVHQWLIIMKPVKVLILGLAFVFSSGKSNGPVKERETIEVVFCLDLSGSTNGLIDDVRDKLWDIVNQVHSYRPAPEFRIGIVGFSRPSFGAKNGYVKVLQDLTTDFDQLNFELYKLKPSIEKGDQFVGQAIQVSLQSIQWSKNPEAIQVIYLVGNGMVNGGASDYREACDFAVKQGVIINTVYCRTKNDANKELSGWREIARLTGGKQFDIRIHKRTPLVLTSPDRETFRSLSQSLAGTYMAYGPEGMDRVKMMAAIDNHAMAANDMSYESRIYFKISDRYQFHQQKWDLVDYLKMNNSDFSEIQREFLMDSLRYREPAEIKQVVSLAKERRNKIILELRKYVPFDRQTIINRQLEEKAIDKSDIFDRVVINSLNFLAEEHGYSTGSASIDFRR